MKYSANSVWENKDEYDVAVVGAGHAGCEAALATARLGFKTVMFTVSVDSIALMPCNPNIGGSSKGHLVRELDALGGEMGKVIDRTFIQSKMLNSSKGPAVHSLRAQADKANYSRTMRQVLQKQENLDIRQMEVTELLTEDEATYAILAKKQAEEENSVDENGQLIGKDKSEETRQASVPTMDLSMERLNDFEYLVSNFYTVDSVTYINPSELNASELLGKDLRIDLSTGGSKILIYHTHSQETFADSDNDPSTSIVGIGRYLTEILNNKYKIPTMHHEGVYDLINGKLDRRSN